MFSKAVDGDRVFCIRKGWGTIESNHHNGTTAYPVRVNFDVGGEVVGYTTSGKYISDDMFQSLFWNEVSFKIPEKPVPKLAVDTKLLVWNKDSKNKLPRYFSRYDEFGRVCAFRGGMDSWSDGGKFNDICWPHWDLVE